MSNLLKIIQAVVEFFITYRETDIKCRSSRHFESV